MRKRNGYSGAIVLGLNDAIVEILGVLAGLTFVLDKTLTVGIVGAVTGVAAALSMASSEYLAAKEDSYTKNKKGKMALVTGVAYLLAVILIIIPYLFGGEKNIAL